MAFHPLCGFSLQKGSRIIAIADFVIFIICISFRVAVYDFLNAEDFEDEENHELGHTNITGAGVEIHKDADTEAMHVNASMELSEIIRHISITEYIFELVGSFIIVMLLFSVEVWLCRLLIGASKNRDAATCKLWFWVRLTVTVCILMVSIFGIATLRHDWADWVLEPLNIYRLYELFVVNEFRKEILATSGRVKLRA